MELASGRPRRFAFSRFHFLFFTSGKLAGSYGKARKTWNLILLCPNNISGGIACALESGGYGYACEGLSFSVRTGGPDGPVRAGDTGCALESGGFGYACEVGGHASSLQ